jgi:hypothetical protein
MMNNHPRCFRYAVNIFATLTAALWLAPTPAVGASESIQTEATSAGISTDAPAKAWYRNIDTRFGGRIKMTGTVSRADNDTFFEPVGTGNFPDGSADLRLINDTFLSDWAYTDIQYENILAGGKGFQKRNELEDAFPGISSPFLLGAPLNDDRRLMDLTDTIRDTEKYVWFQRLDRLNLAFLPSWGSVRIGRQALTWGNGLIFNPLDLINPFAPTDIDRDYKVGEDMITAIYNFPGGIELQGAAVARRNPETDDVTFDESTMGAKLHFAVGSTELDLVGARNYEDYVIGIGSRGYLGNAAWRCDASWTILNSGDGGGSNNYLSLVVNLDYSWVWSKKNFYGLIEFYYNGLGETDNYGEALFEPAVTDRLARGELFVLGKYYASGTLQVELHPLVNVFLTAINNVKDPSGILQPRLTWDVLQNLQMTVGANIFYGEKGSEYGGFIIPGTDIRSRSPDSAYLWLIYYF